MTAPGGFQPTDDGTVCLGWHMLLDLWCVPNLEDQGWIEDTLKQAARASGATLLHSHFHPFEGGGFSGVIVLAESHISIHTWPEHGHAAIDVFMCGSCSPLNCLETIFSRLKPALSRMTVFPRGERPPENQKKS